MDPNREPDPNFASYTAIKTHLLPDQLPYPDAPAVYLVRDGRDSLVSIAHHRKDIVEPGTNFYNNLLEAILSPGGSNFGGWLENVKQWTEKAAIIIHFEELIKDPISQVERLREIMDLPPPNREKLPTFQQLKFGDPRYGAGKPSQKHLELAKRHFRKGKKGSFKEEMPPELEELFWRKSGALMESLGYDRKRGFVGVGNVEPAPLEKAIPGKILLEAAKLFSPDNDGVKRYLMELAEHLPPVLKWYPELQVDLFYQNSIQPIWSKEGRTGFTRAETVRKLDVDNEVYGYERLLLEAKKWTARLLPGFIYRPLAAFYRKGPFRKLLHFVRQRRIEVEQQKNKDEKKPEDYDLIHVPLPQNIYWFDKVKGRFLVTIHDLTHRLFPDFHTSSNIELAEKGMERCLEKEADMLAISKATASDIQKFYPVEPSRIHLCYEASNFGRFNPTATEGPAKAVLEKYDIPDQPYFICLSTIEPRKNLENIIRAFQLLRAENPELAVNLVICGKRGWKTDQLFDLLKADTDRIHLTGFVDDADLPILYARARALCYVSYYEGFGLPILEAMSCKTPVIYGDNSSMPEVAGAGGLPADPADPESIKTQMLRLLSEEAFYLDMREAAWMQTNQFSWWRAAFETIAIYRKILSRNT
ncbi:MAG: glycosyltransferase [Bacteroidetes bacterium]|nr:glycosyltransferase [Bacteroidota bacterium]